MNYADEPTRSPEKARISMIETIAPKSEKVVIQFGSKTVKGFLESPAWNTIEELLSSAPQAAPEIFRVRLLDSNAIEEISTRDIKAVFYVNSFEGNPGAII